MKQQFKTLLVLNFPIIPPPKGICVKYLADHKWSSGYSLKNCGHMHYCEENNLEGRRCNDCCYVESAYAESLFHCYKFSILKACNSDIYVSITKNGIRNTELSRKLALRLKIFCLFKRKVMKKRESSTNFPIGGKLETDETYVQEQNDTAIGRIRGRKQIVRVPIEKKGKGIYRTYACVITTLSKRNLKGFMKYPIKSEESVFAYKWTACHKGLEEVFPNIVSEKSENSVRKFPTSTAAS